MIYFFKEAHKLRKDKSKLLEFNNKTKVFKLVQHNKLLVGDQKEGETSVPIRTR